MTSSDFIMISRNQIKGLIQLFSKTSEIIAFAEGVTRKVRILKHTFPDDVHVSKSFEKVNTIKVNASRIIFFIEQYIDGSLPFDEFVSKIRDSFRFTFESIIETKESVMDFERDEKIPPGVCIAPGEYEHLDQSHDCLNALDDCIRVAYSMENFLDDLLKQ